MVKTTVLGKNKVTKPKTIEVSWEDLLETTKEVPKDYRSIKEISKEAGLSQSATRIKLAKLLEQGLVKKIVRCNTAYYTLKIGKSE